VYFKLHDLNVDSTFFYIILYYSNLLMSFLFFIPSVLVIEKYGVNKAIVFSNACTCLGLWIGYAGLFAFGSLIISIGQPFSLNVVTKISASWFGPKGRAFSTGIQLASIYLGISIIQFTGSSVADGHLAYSILATFLIPVSYLLVYDKPDFSPTMSEENKLDKVFNIKVDWLEVKMNKSYCYMALACICFNVIIL
jgi:hypothetical protein